MQVIDEALGEMAVGAIDVAIVIALDHDPIVDSVELELIMLIVDEVEDDVALDLDPIGPLIQHFDVVFGAVLDTVRSRFRLVDVGLNLISIKLTLSNASDCCLIHRGLKLL